MPETEKPELSPKEKELAEILAKRAELAEAMKARDAAKALDDTIARERRNLENEEAIAKAETEHGRIVDGKIAAIETRLGVVIVKCPKNVFYKRFMDGKNGRKDAEALVAHCLVHPSQGDFDALLEELPATLDVAMNTCAQLAGITAKEVSGK